MTIGNTPTAAGQDPTVDLDEARRFLRALDPTTDCFCFQTFDDNKERVDRRLARVYFGTLDAKAPVLSTLNDRGCGIFVVVNATKGGASSRTSEDIGRVRAHVIDMDVPGNVPTARKKIAASGLTPSITVESSPGKYHFYWLVDDCTLEQFQPTQQALIDYFGSDGTIKDLPRVLRIPGFIHQKELPVRTRLVEVTDARYHHADVLNAFGLTLSAALPGTPPTVASAAVIQFPALPGTPPTVASTRTSTLAAAAQTGLPAPSSWFDRLDPAQKNEMLRAIAAHPSIVAQADLTERIEDGWLQVLYAFADAERLGATEAREIALSWAKTSAKFKSEADFDKDWRSFKPDRPKCSKVGTLIRLAEKAGVDLTRWQAASPTTVVALSGPTPMTAIPAWLTPDVALALMNETVVFCHDWGGETLLAHLQADGSVRAINNDQLKCSLENRRVAVQSKDKTIYVPLAEFWLRHEHRREVDRVVFDPENKLIRPNEKTLNLWNGLAREPLSGRWRLMARHLFVIVCRRDRECWNYLIRWLAHTVQHPGTAPGSVIVLRSTSEGAGKSLVLAWMCNIFGEHGISLNTPEDFTGEFNDHLENKAFIGLNEPSFPGDHKAAGKFKSMITESEWVLNGKFRKRRRVPNIAHIMLTTNRKWAIPAGNKARRFLMLDVNESRVGDEVYFKALRSEAEHGGIEAMLYALLHIDLTEFNPWRVPRTEALWEQQRLSAPSTVRWLTGAVHSGELIPPDPHFGALPNGGFGQVVHGPTLYRAYERWCGSKHERAEDDVAFGRWLTACGIRATHRSNGATYRAVPDARTVAASVLQEAGIV